LFFGEFCFHPGSVLGDPGSVGGKHRALDPPIFVVVIRRREDEPRKRRGQRGFVGAGRKARQRRFDRGMVGQSHGCIFQDVSHAVILTF